MLIRLSKEEREKDATFATGVQTRIIRIYLTISLEDTKKDFEDCIRYLVISCYGDEGHCFLELEGDNVSSPKS